MLCNKLVKYMVSHLIKSHKKEKEEAKNLSKRTRAVRKGVTQKNTPVRCPVSQCNSVICRVDLHLRRVHRINKLDPEYKQLNNKV